MKRVITTAKTEPEKTRVAWTATHGYPCGVTKTTEAEAEAFADTLRRNGFKDVVVRAPDERGL